MAFDIGSAVSGAASGSSFGAVGAVVGGIAGGLFGGKAKKARKKINRLSRRAAALTAFRDRQQALRSRRLQLGELEAQAAATGLTESSGFQGAAGSFTTQSNAALGFANQQGLINKRIQKLGGKALRAEGALSILGSVGSFGAAFAPQIGAAAGAAGRRAQSAAGALYGLGLSPFISSTGVRTVNLPISPVQTFSVVDSTRGIPTPL